MTVQSERSAAGFSPDDFLGGPLDFPRAHGSVCGEAVFRREPEDFQVNEVLGFSPAGEGEHLCLHIEKRNQNTRWVAGLLAESLGVNENAVGYCGLKDRRAVTRQWFSVHTRQTPGMLALGHDINVLSTTRHHKKLRRGIHQSNQFVIRLREFGVDPERLDARLQTIGEQGVPHYFGEQRFGFNAGNLQEADRLLSEAADQSRRHRKGKNGWQQRGGLYLSAARSYLFNLVLAERVKRRTWNLCLEGETVAEGPLWGRGRSSAPAIVAELEKNILKGWQHWCSGLEFSGLQQERRPLVLTPASFSWQQQGEDLELAFTLPAGAYATAVLREIAVLKQIARPL
ncbi:MAG: tRNA pseudouridine(13) synthase TruD [Porticoccaceae bacterium]|nr:tRNA pseudouridine(13) synthase TruD [Pseudomonadales bacterium]MCP5171408.1 tRNA pseudouridine(13) synthase TruD [Pseudomonadales bacterium]